MNGDCDRSAARKQSGLGPLPEGERLQTEDRADALAKELLRESALLFYRFPPSPKGEHERIGAALRQGDINAILQIISPQRLLEIQNKVQDLHFKMACDDVIAVEAQKFIFHFRQTFSSCDLS